jgi:hypothetical protein
VRRSILGFTTAFLLIAAVPLFGLATNIIDDVIKMTRARVDQETIITFIQAEKKAFGVTADDMIALTNAHVSKEVVQALLDQSAVLKQTPAAAVGPATSEGARNGEARETPPSEPSVVVLPPPFIPDYLADPFWYLPRLDMKSGASAVKPAARAHSPANRPAVNAKPFKDDAPAVKPPAKPRPPNPPPGSAESHGGMRGHR